MYRLREMVLKCYIARVYDTEIKSFAGTDKEKTNALPDESIIPVGAERSPYAEVLSRASFNGEEACGIHDTSLLTKCDVDIRKNLYASVVPPGGIHVPRDQ